MICNNCLTELSGTPKFCPKCGASIQAPIELAKSIKQCPQCGAENPIGAKFCIKDGYRFKGIETPASQFAAKTDINDSPPQSVIAVEPVVTVSSPERMVPPKPEAVRLTADVQSETTPPKIPESGEKTLADSSCTAEPISAKTTRREGKASSKGLVIGLVGAIAVAAAGAGGYVYWSGNRAERKQPDTVENAPHPATLLPGPPPATKPSIAESATSSSPSQPVAPSGVEIAPKVDVARIQDELDERLQRAGFADIDGSVDTEGSVNVNGIVSSKKQKEEVVRLALSIPGVERVNDAELQVAAPAKAVSAPPRVALTPPSAPTPDPAKLEGDINRALRNSGVGGVTAQVSDDFSVTLKGSATNTAEKSRAFQITRQFRGVGATHDRIFVVE